MGITCGAVDAALEQKYFPLGAPWLYGDTQSDDNPHINGLITAIFGLITFQNIIPISLYISIEFVRTIQAMWIYFDHDMYYAKTDQQTLARSWNLSDDLGQIEYIFSDKTGTLTQNAMIFRQCSVAGTVYRGDEESPSSSDEKLKDKFEADDKSKLETAVNETISWLDASQEASMNEYQEKQKELEEKWEEEMIEAVGGWQDWQALSEQEQKAAKRAKWAKELGGWDD